MKKIRRQFLTLLSQQYSQQAEELAFLKQLHNMKNRINQRIRTLQTKWQLNSVWQVVAVLITFSLAGSTVVVIRPWFFQLLGMGEHTSWVWKTVAYVVFVFPMYQVLLVVYGSLLGQHRFFTQKTKRALRAIVVSQSSKNT